MADNSSGQGKTNQGKPDPLKKPGIKDNPAAIGECTYSGCNCKNFIGGYKCDNCGHGNSWHL
jgi:hypothetical protein